MLGDPDHKLMKQKSKRETEKLNYQEFESSETESEEELKTKEENMGSETGVLVKK